MIAAREASALAKIPRGINTPVFLRTELAELETTGGCHEEGIFLLKQDRTVAARQPLRVGNQSLHVVNTCLDLHVLWHTQHF